MQNPDQPTLTTRYSSYFQLSVKEYQLYGYEYHRMDGPAVIWDDGIKYWYVYGKQIKVNSQQEFEQYMRLKAFW